MTESCIVREFEIYKDNENCSTTVLLVTSQFKEACNESRVQGGGLRSVNLFTTIDPYLVGELKTSDSEIC